MKQMLSHLQRLLALCLMLLSVTAVMAQVKITGTVVDANGEPIIGANVLEVGTQNGTITDIDGNFSLNVAKVGKHLQVSFVGYKTIELPAMSKPMSIIIEEDSEVLDDVVVVGYGVTQRKNFTGSVTTVKVGEGPVSNLASGNAFDMLRGQTTGVTFSQSGVAGAESSLQVRGQKSINGGSDPLIVLDGVIFMGSINDIDPNSIESMSVLKDATTLAAYGSQAANGVIMITSKKGLKGKPVVSFKADLSAVQQDYTPKMLDGEGYVQLYNARWNKSEGDLTWLSALEQENYKAGRSTDWVDLLTQTGLRQNYSSSISGATENTNYMFGVSYTDAEGFIVGNEYLRTTLNGRINTTINKYVSVGMNFNYANKRNDNMRPNYTYIRITPLGSAYLPDGKTLRKYPDGKEYQTNPLWNTESGYDYYDHSDAVTGGGELNIKVPHVDGLSFKVTGNYSINRGLIQSFQHEQNVFNPSVTADEYTADDYASALNLASGYITDTRTTSWVTDYILTYTKEWGKNFLSASAVYTRDSKKYTLHTAYGENFADLGNTTLGYYGLANAGSQKVSDIQYSLHNDVGYLGRINYSWNNTYHLNVSVRRDGSSVFGSEHKWGTFPAFGGAWTISNENFMKPITWLSNTKLKLSWGKNGNQSLTPYGTLSTMNVGKSGGITYYFDGKAYFGQGISALGNPQLAWETTTSWNYGLETDILKGLLHYEIDAYNSQTTDQIFSRTIPVMGSGLTTQSSTMGKIANWGIEQTLRATPVKTKDFQWTSTLTFSINRNKLKELYGDGKDDITNKLFIGQSLGAIYGYNFIGVVQEEDTQYMQANGVTAGAAKYEDVDNDGKITTADRKILGFDKENFRMTWSNSFSYKNWSLYFLLDGIFSGGMYGKGINNMAFLSYEGMQYTNSLDHPYWTKENRDNKHPRPDYYDNDKFTGIQNYTCIRLQDLNLSYNFKGEWMKKCGLSQLQLYVSGHNLCFWAPDWEFSDPAIHDDPDNSFVASRSAQLQRTYTVGINLKF